MKKKGILITSLALALLLVVGGVMAWFTANEEITNHFKAGTLNVDLIEDFVPNEDTTGNVNPGDGFDKKVYVKNEGTKRAYVRIKVTPTWTLAQGKVFGEGFGEHTLAPADYVGLNKTDWIYHEVEEGDGYYYYNKILPAGETAPDLFTGIKFAKTMGNEYQGADFDLKVEMEAIQVTNGAALDVWGIDPTTLPIAP